MVLGMCVCACGCVESQLEAQTMGSPVSDALPAIQSRAELLPPVDTFWAQEAADIATRPDPPRARSISLGYVGDAPLTGGVMRDTPMAPMNPYFPAR